MKDTMIIRIGTRDSRLATWQAEKVQLLLKNAGHVSKLVFIKSEGDINLVTPLYEVGVQGIFTRALDVALLAGKIDIAVHSYKDVPTKPAVGLQIAAVLQRDDPGDLLLCKNEEARNEIIKAGTSSLQKNIFFKIATSSIRRKAQWLHQFPNSGVDNIRGNVISRIEKLKSSNWHGAIFAAAGIERLQLTEEETGPQLKLPWMVPAPAQGAMAIMCRENDAKMLEACMPLNDGDTALCTLAERDFLRILLGGCSTPIAALARVMGQEMKMDCDITSTDGKEKITCTVEGKKNDAALLAQKAAEQILLKGAGKILKR